MTPDLVVFVGVQHAATPVTAAQVSGIAGSFIGGLMVGASRTLQVSGKRKSASNLIVGGGHPTPTPHGEARDRTTACETAVSRAAARQSSAHRRRSAVVAGRK